MLKLTEHVGITTSFSISKKPGKFWYSELFIAKFWIFAYFTQNITIFRSGMLLWRHNHVTPWPIVLILVCMSREGPYLPIDTKINFIGKSREVVATTPPPPLVTGVTKNSLVRRGISKTPGQIQISRPFFREKNQFWPIFRWKLTFSGRPCFITSLWLVTSYADRFSWFWYQWKEETLPYTMVPNNYTFGRVNFKFTGGW